MLFFVCFAVFSHLFIHPIGRINLHAGLCCENFHFTTTRWSINISCKHTIALLLFAETPVIVNSTSGHINLSIHTFVDNHRGAEIKCSSVNRTNFARRSERIIENSHKIGIDLQQMIAHSTISGTFQIEIRVIGQSDHCRLISRCFVVNTQLVIVSKLVCTSYIQVSGITFFAIGRKQAKHQFRRSYFFYIPHLGIESIHTTMQCVCSIVDSQIIFHTINFEFTVLDAVCKTTTHSTKVLFFLNHFVECIESEHHIVEFSIAISCKKANHFGSEIGNIGTHAIAVFQCKHRNSLTINYFFHNNFF